MKKRYLPFFFKSLNDNRALLVRLIVGLIFLSEGIQKYLFPELVGTGRFDKIGFSDPAFWAYLGSKTGSPAFMGRVVTRLAAIPLLTIMITAFVTTKWPILTNKGFWAMAHAYRTDFAMTLLLIYLLIYGAGSWSIDSEIYKPS